MSASTAAERRPFDATTFANILRATYQQPPGCLQLASTFSIGHPLRISYKLAGAGTVVPFTDEVRNPPHDIVWCDVVRLCESEWLADIQKALNDWLASISVNLMLPPAEELNKKYRRVDLTELKSFKTLELPLKVHVPAFNFLSSTQPTTLLTYFTDAQIKQMFETTCPIKHPWENWSEHT